MICFSPIAENLLCKFSIFYGLPEVIVFVGEFLDNLEILGLDILLQHRWRGVAGDRYKIFG